MSVLVHAELVQLLAGNAVIAKTPSQGGALCLTVAHALMARAGLPATLLSGGGEELSEVLVRAPEIGAVAFVGGRSNGGKVAAALLDTDKRHMIEQEGLNAWGIWEFSQWDTLAAHIRKGFEYGKQRCTAYPRFVVQRELVDSFLDVYLPVVKSVRFGHPLAVSTAGQRPARAGLRPAHQRRPRPTSCAARWTTRSATAPSRCYRGRLASGRFLDGQDTSAYVAPSVLLAPPGRSHLMHAEPFGPVDSIIVVDTVEELLAAMNASNGALVASLACDDEELAAKLAVDVQAFKVGINKPALARRPRGALRRPRRLVEGRLRRRRPAGAGGHRRASPASGSTATSPTTRATRPPEAHAVCVEPCSRRTRRRTLPLRSQTRAWRTTWPWSVVRSRPAAHPYQLRPTIPAQGGVGRRRGIRAGARTGPARP